MKGRQRLSLYRSAPAPSQEVASGQERGLCQEGFAGNASIITLGCAKNTVDSEVMLGSLRSRGYTITADLENADLIVVNTCGFIQEAVEESIDAVLEAATYRKDGRCRQLVVAGCLVERLKSELAQALPEVDAFLSIDEITKVGLSNSTSKECFDKSRRPYFLYDETTPRTLSSDSGSVYIKIAEGCDRPCSFCIIPQLRGTFRSREVASVKEEVSRLLDSGVVEFNLVAQDLTAYGSDRGRHSELLSLLEGLESMSGDFWVRLLYAYPIGVDDALLELINSGSKICPYLDLPLQHISGPVLKAMRRPLGEDGTRKLVEKISSQYSKIHLRTSLIVGFPGESKEDVRSLEGFVEQGHFAHLGVFTYSREKGTIAAGLPDQISEHEKHYRRDLLMSAQSKVVAQRLHAHLGKRESILLEGFHPDSDMLLVGRTKWQAPETDGVVIVNAIEGSDSTQSASREGNFNDFVENAKGHVYSVAISEVLGYDLAATLLV